MGSGGFLLVQKLCFKFLKGKSLFFFQLMSTGAGKWAWIQLCRPRQPHAIKLHLVSSAYQGLALDGSRNLVVQAVLWRLDSSETETENKTDATLNTHTWVEIMPRVTPFGSLALMCKRAQVLFPPHASHSTHPRERHSRSILELLDEFHFHLYAVRGILHSGGYYEQGKHTRKVLEKT